MIAGWLPLILVGLVAGTAVAQESVEAPVVELLFHADLDGRLAPLTCADPPGRAVVTDYAALTGRIAAARTQAVSDGVPVPLALLGGNIATPDLYGASLLERGPSGIAALGAILSEAHYDAVALGHHELSLSEGQLHQLVTALKRNGAPVIATNLRCDGRVRRQCPPVQADALIKHGPVMVGVVATISPAVVSGIPRALLAGLSLDDPVKTAGQAIQRLRQQGAGLVVLMVQGPRDASSLDQMDALARQLSTAPAAQRPDVILAGGLAGDPGDRPVLTLRREGAAPIAGSPTGANGLTRIRLAMPPTPASPDDTVRAPPTVEIDPLPSRGEPRDPKTAARLDAEMAIACASYGAAIAPAPIRDVLTREAFTTYAIEVMRQRAGAEIALLNRAFVKAAPFPFRGTLTRAQLHRALPFRAVVGVGKVPGAVVDSVLGAALAKDRVSVVGLTRTDGRLEVNGRALDKTRAYKVATIAFVASGGDGIVSPGTLPWRPLPGDPDLRDLVEDFLSHHTADRDGDPSIDPNTDFGGPVSLRPLLVALGDLGLDLASTSIANSASYTDTQLVRASQLAITGNASGLLQVRDRVHEADLRLDLKYGWSRNQPIGSPLTSGETSDLITFSGVYNFRGLRGPQFLLKRTVPDPFVRIRLESEFTRPDVTATQARAFHHAQMTNTAGVLFTVLPKLKLRAGAGAQAELLASGANGAWQPVLEAGGTLDPVAVASLGPLVVKLEGLVDYDFVDPTGLRQHQVRGRSKLSVPLLPALFITLGVDVFAVQRERQGWGTAADVIAGLRVHHDVAYQGQ